MIIPKRKRSSLKQILTDNAELAWASALRYRDILLSGRDTLQNKKNFVSSFHNAIELYTKQLMIFNNDYRVIDIKNDEKDGHFAKEYFASENLDVFFTNLKKEELIKLRTCDFSKMPINEIYGQCKEKPIDPDGAIKLLTRLRNEETHFAFSNEFMTDSEFIKLDRFLLRYYKILMDVGLLPKCFGRRKSFINSIENRLVPNDNNRCNAQKGFTFKKRLQEFGRCSFNKKFIEEIEGKSFESYGKDAFGITEAVYYQSEELSGKFSFEEIWDYIVSYLKYELISVEENVETAIDMDSNAGWNTYISIKWKGTR